MGSRLLQALRRPRKLASYTWTLLRSLTLALADRLLFPLGCRPLSLGTELRRCHLAAALTGFPELIFAAPPGLPAADYRTAGLDGVPAVVVPPEARLDDFAERPAVVLLYAHGGGYLFGEPLMYIESYKRWVEAAAAKGIRLVIVSVNYRTHCQLKLHGTVITLTTTRPLDNRQVPRIPRRLHRCISGLAIRQRHTPRGDHLWG